MYVLVPMAYDQIEEYLHARFAFGPFLSINEAEEIANDCLGKYQEYRILEILPPNRGAIAGEAKHLENCLK